jgi:hypothetical protein
MSVDKTKAGGNWWKRVFGANEDVRPTEVKQPEPTPVVDVRDDAPLGQVAGRPQAPAPVITSEAQKPWQSRLDVSSKEDSLVIAKATLAVMTGVPLDILTEPVKSAAASLIRDENVGDPKAVARIYDRMIDTLHPDALSEALEALASTTNEAIHASIEMVGHKDEVPIDKGDIRDWHRTWGLRLLPDDDDAFRDPEYLVNFNLESRGIRATSFEGRTSITGAREMFEAEWAKLAPNTKVRCYTESGSDSVSLCFQIATACGRRRLQKRDINAGMAFFDGCYGGGRGLASSMNWAGWGRDSAERKNEWRVPSPTSNTMNPTGAELERV